MRHDLLDNFIEVKILEKNIKDIWNGPNSFIYAGKFKIEDLGEKCKVCKFGKTCKGGCTTLSSSLTGKPHNDPLCFYKFEKKTLKC